MAILQQYVSTRTGAFQLAWRIGAFIVLILVLIYFTPVIAYQSVMKLPLSQQWAYVLVMVAISFLTTILDGVFASSVVVAVFHWVLALAWFVAFGIFAKIYLHRNPKLKADRYKGTNTSKM